MAGVVGALLAALLGAGTASAIIVHLPSGKTASYQPRRGTAVPLPPDAAFGNLDYNGGPVMPSNTNYVIYWSPSGYGAYGVSEYTSGINRYFSDLAHDSGQHTNVDSVASQYNDSSGQTAAYQSRWGGALLDADAYPANDCPVGGSVTHCFSDADIQAELSRFLNAHHLPRDLTHEYFLLTPQHVQSCFDSDPADGYGGCSDGEPSSIAVYCAYHSQSDGSPVFLYADDPYLNGDPNCESGNHPNGPSDSAIDAGLSHEHNESITDPVAGSGWIDYQQQSGNGNGGEDGDQCAVGGPGGGSQYGPVLGTAPNGSPYNQVINGHFYYYQEEWSNQAHRCLQRFTMSGSPPPNSFSAATNGGRAMTFTGVSSSAIARYDWQFNDGPGLQSPFESTSAVAKHTFPAATQYLVALTTYTSNGTSRGNGGIITPGFNGFSSGIGYSSNPVAGSPVGFGAFSKLDGVNVTAYSWTFGDGGTAVGIRPTHTYGAAGTYRVRVTMFINQASTGVQVAGLAWRNITVN